ncbi:valine--tRNA ligase [[Clostridium] colinum]|uniref:valine--tRNA ligase n=1 Tax=[Clostridium] colinum TaxID=36835 RepID=UPI002024FCEC|nr:valine--tRNA ligase [[Clostridium] colinum]
MKKELEKNYNPSIEDRIYKNWLEKKYFHAKVDKNKIPYTIVIPPPNITGHLHMGHALDNTLQDILIRWKRMQGYSALWLPGTDHASISTEVKIIDKLAKEGITKDDLGREEFLKRAWQWKEEYGGTIVNQLKKLGNSCDWDRERFTMDEGLSNAVTEVFIKLYEKGYIYKGEKLINWCPNCQTTISDAEVEHEDKNGFFWHIKYPIKGTNEFLQFATTRPETMLGDTAIAVNPNDDRYRDFIGKTCVVPFVNREIPIIADEYVDMEFGTGVVKITPAHDPNDFEVGQRHNLPKINIFNDDGTINENGGQFKGLYRYDARKEIIKELDKLGLFIKEQPISHAVGTHERCSHVVEPLIKSQWFVKMEELAKPALEAYYKNELRFIPDRFGKIYTHWLENIKDWCISRQLWWGHRIPAYYCEKCGHIEVSKEMPKCCSKCNHTSLVQDEDTLDTWFSSALWPFSTLGWPEKTEELEYFYPTNVLVTGYDIIFFWVVRMVFSGLEQMNELPFKDVLIHGLVRDSEGRKMSKSLGNGIDPLEVIEKYGADALRLMLISGNSAGNDLRFYWEKIESNRNFLNKIWNATRFILMNLEDEDLSEISLDTLTDTDKWILSKCNTLTKEVTQNLESYDLGVALSKIYDFIWDEYCDWYIEMVKPRLYNKDDNTRKSALYTLKTVLINSLKLLHPFAPFATEEIFTTIQDDEETIMLSKWPTFNTNLNFKEEEEKVELIKTAVKGIRNLRAEMNVPNSKKAQIIISSNNDFVNNTFKTSEVFFKTLAFASDMTIKEHKNAPEGAVSVVIPNGVIYMPFDELVDIEKELDRLKKEEDKLIKEVERVDKKLSNQGFVAKAPQKVIEEEKEKMSKYKDMLEKVKEQINTLKK